MTTHLQTWRLDDPEISGDTRLVFRYCNNYDPEQGCSVEDAGLLAAVIDVYDVSEEEAARMIKAGIWDVILTSHVRERLPQAAEELAARTFRDSVHREAVVHEIRDALLHGRDDRVHLNLRRLSHFAFKTLAPEPPCVADNDDATLVEA